MTSSVFTVIDTCTAEGTGPLYRRSAISTRVRVRFRVRDRVRVRVRVWIVWYMDVQTAARFGIADLRNSGPKSS